MPKRTSRSALRERQLRNAAAVMLPATCDVCVVGGGAAGLVAAICAAEAGASVVVLERELECGKPILATGNGRCNFCNVRLEPKRFNDPGFVADVCGPSWLDDVLAFFRDCGMRWCLEDDRLYPLSRQASSVRNVLLARAHRAGVVLAPGRALQGLSWHEAASSTDAPPTPHDQASPGDAPPLAGAARRPAGFAQLRHAKPLGADGPSHIAARAVVLATGGVALPFLDGLGLRSTPRTPVLCPLACAPSPLAALDGRRAQVRASLTRKGLSFPSWAERGEVLFRSYGLSGIVSFDLSRHAGAGDLVELDLIPDVSTAELQQIVDPWGSGGFAEGALDGLMDPSIARLLEELARGRWRIDWPERRPPDSDAAALMALAKALPLVLTGPARTETAQVMRGGLANGQFARETLASRERPWFHACGEALDVDADCGGFNLAWAWKSGMVAGSAAARWARP